MLILFIQQSPEGTALIHRRFQPPQKQRYDSITSEVSTSVKHKRQCNLTTSEVSTSVSMQHLPHLLFNLGTSQSRSDDAAVGSKEDDVRYAFDVKPIG